MKVRRTVALCATIALAGGAAACGGSSGDDGGSSGGQGKKTSGGKVISVDSMNAPPKGTITWCAAKDITGAFHSAVKRYNAKYKAEGYSVKLLEFPESADEQRTQFVQRQQSRSPECDVFGSDVIWTAEFAAQHWLYDMTPYVESRKDEFIPSTFETTRYEGRNWAVPFGTNTGFLFYRTDKVSGVPASWQEVYADARKDGGIAYQGASYEGLTCDYLEIAFAAGGKVLSDDGKQAVIDSPENLKALKFMADGVKDGTAPKAVTTYMEEPARQAFESGQVAFQRNWHYAWGLGQKAPKTKGKMKAIPLPPFEGGGKAGILGGVNLVISTFSKNPGAALKLIDYLTSAETQSRLADQQPPTLTAVYDDPAAQKRLGFPAAQFREGVEQAHARPASPVYPLISQAIYKNVNAALAGRVTPEAALKRAQQQMTDALKTF